MPIDGQATLAEVSLVDADLVARLPYVSTRYLPAGGNFATQIALGIDDAKAAFEENTGLAPATVVPRAQGAWKRICVLHALCVVLRPNTDPLSKEMLTELQAELRRLEQSFLYRHDRDGSGTLTDSIEENPRRVGELVIRR